MGTFPLELVFNVAVYSDTETLLRAATVSRAWRQLINNTPDLWRHPHFKIMSVNENGSIRLTPHPMVISSRLQAISLLSLHFTWDRSVWNYGVGTILEKRGAEIWEGFLAPLTHNLQGPLHLILHGACPSTFEELFEFVASCTTVSMLSLGTRPFYLSSLLSNFSSLAICAEPSPRRFKNIEVYSWADGQSSFHPSPTAPLPSNTVELRPYGALGSAAHGSILPSPPGHANTDDTQNLQHPCMHVSPLCFFPYESVVFRIPPELHEDWKEGSHSQLRMTRFRSLQISGGHWKLTERTEAPYLVRLSCRNIWTLICSQVHSKLPRLLSFELSFHPEGNLEGATTRNRSSGKMRQKFKWGNIARFLSITLVPTIQSISVSFPAAIVERVQRDPVDTVWTTAVSEMFQLQEVTFGNYIPTTLSVICENYDCRRSLQKLVLAYDTLPEDFTTAFTPENLPSLNHLDISTVRIEGGAAANEALQRWISKWNEVGIKTFLPPLGVLQPSPAYRRVNL